MTPERFQQLCDAGDAADALLGSQPEQAIQCYETTLADMRAGKEIDSFVLAKITLSLMLAHLRRSDLAKAHAQWTSDPKSIFGLGIQCLERKQTSTHDQALYAAMSKHIQKAFDQAVPALAITFPDPSKWAITWGTGAATIVRPNGVVTRGQALTPQAAEESRHHRRWRSEFVK